MIYFAVWFNNPVLFMDGIFLSGRTTLQCFRFFFDTPTFPSAKRITSCDAPALKTSIASIGITKHTGIPVWIFVMLMTFVRLKVWIERNPRLNARRVFAPIFCAPTL